MPGEKGHSGWRPSKPTCRIDQLLLRLTLLTPDIVEAILNGQQPAEMTLAVLMSGGFP